MNKFVNFPTSFSEADCGDDEEPFELVPHRKGKNKVFKNSVSDARCSQSKAPTN